MVDVLDLFQLVHMVTTLSIYLFLFKAVVFFFGFFQVLFILCNSAVSPLCHAFVGHPLFRCPLGFHSCLLGDVFCQFFVVCDLFTWNFYSLFAVLQVDVCSFPKLFLGYHLWLTNAKDVFEAAFDCVDCCYSFVSLQVSDPYNRYDFSLV